MNDFPDKKVAIFGLGIIGTRACARLHEAGWDVACWSRSRHGLAGEVEAASDAVAGASFLSIYLKDAPAVKGLMSQIEPFLQPRQVLLNHATLDLETTLWLAARCAALGCGFLDAPFTGSKLAIQNGQLFYYIGGDLERIEQVKSYLAVTSRGHLHCGDIGTGTVVKLTTNLISACTVQAMAESLAIATRNGVSAECLMQAVADNACASALSAAKFPIMIEGIYEPHFSLANMAKDSRYALALTTGVESPALRAVSKHMDQLSENGLGEFDFSVVAKPYFDNPS